MSKYYAVRKGSNTGIFTSWDETKKYVTGFSGAEYKSFSTLEDAEKYMEITGNNEKSPNTLEIKGAYAFVDGSFNEDTNTYGFGGFLYNNGIYYPLSGSGNIPEKAAMRNVAGEIEGSLAAAKLASEQGLKRLTILYDYVGIEAWVTGAWKTKKPETKEYRDKIREIIANGLAIRFVKVAAHTGIKGNELADSLAKQAVGL